MAIQTGVYRIGRDTETRYLPSGEAVCNLSLAYNYGKKDAAGKQETTWIDATLWGKRAESAPQWLTKGKQIFVVLSDLRLEAFNKKDGSQGSKIAARVDSFDFINSPREQTADSQPARREASPPSAQRQAPAKAAGPADAGFDDMDDDIPFVSGSACYDMTTRKTRRVARYGY
jgi:single-strand DNA-binding protein